jgi:hypothetical protein
MSEKKENEECPICDCPSCEGSGFEYGDWQHGDCIQCWGARHSKTGRCRENLDRWYPVGGEEE